MKNAVRSPLLPPAAGPYNQAVRAGDFVFISGQIGIDPERPESGLVSGGIEAQTKQVLGNLQRVLEAAGLTLNDVVKTTVFLADMGSFAQMNAIYATFFTKEHPARSTVGVSALPKGAQVEIEAIALARAL